MELTVELTDEGLPVLKGLPDEIKAQIKDALIEWTITKGKTRRKYQEKFSAVDYLVGAMIPFFTLDMAKEIPFHWIIFPSAGRDVFEESENNG